MTSAAQFFDNIPFSPDISLLKDDPFFHGDYTAPGVRHIWEKGLALLHPKALLRPVEVLHDPSGRVSSIGGVRVSSILLDENLKDCHRAFCYVATCGRELAALSSTVDEERSALFSLRILAVHAALQHVMNHVKETYDIQKLAALNPGSLPQWPRTEQPKLFQILGNVEEALGVTINDAFYLVPTESVSGLLYETDTEYRNCMICPREGCVGRQAPYDPQMAEKYK